MPVATPAPRAPGSRQNLPVIHTPAVNHSQPYGRMKGREKRVADIVHIGPYPHCKLLLSCFEISENPDSQEG